MALPLAKLTILLGAGLVGSVLVNEGRMSDFVSGAFKIVVKQIYRKDDSSSSGGKPQNASLLAQVNSLRQELQQLASNRPVTIITGSGSGRSTVGAPVVVVVIVVGYGYIWWKGWKLSDMMFATRRSLSDARTSVAKQLEQLNSSVTATKRQLSSRIEHVDSNIEEFKELTSATKSEVHQLQGEVGIFSTDVESVHRVVKTLETKIEQIDRRQDNTNRGVQMLVDYSKTLPYDRNASIQELPSTPSRPALESPPVTRTSSESLSTSSRPAHEGLVVTRTKVLSHTISLPSGLLSVEQASPSIQASPSTSSREALGIPQRTPTSRTSSMSTPTELPSPSSTKDASSSSGRFGWLFKAR